ncbi:hypothetical protein LXL04_015422 [Taraxacum kok-saghyz]
MNKMAVNRRDIAQILEMESISTNHEDNEFTVLAKIVQLDHGSGWCYASCSKCNKNLDAIDDSFVCSICNQECRYPIIRYKIHVHVIDESGRTTFVIFNQEAEKLLDSCANKSVNRLGVGSNQFPEEIVNLKGKIFIFKINVAPYNVNYGCENYAVIKLYDVYGRTSDFESKKKENDTPLITEEEDAFGKQMLLSIQNNKKRNTALLITDEDDAFGKQVWLSSEIVDCIYRADTSVYSAIVGKEPIQLKMKKLKSGKMWEAINFKNDNDIMGLEMVFVDDKGDLIQAYIRKNHMKRYKPMLEESEVYAIRNFRVAKSVIQYKTHEERVYNNTILTCTFPTDIIRCVVGVGEIEYVGKAMKKDIELITDSEKIMPVTLWGNISAMIDYSPYKSDDTPVIAIITSITIKTFQGLLRD